MSDERISELRARLEGERRAREESLQRRLQQHKHLNDAQRKALLNDLIEDALD